MMNSGLKQPESQAVASISRLQLWLLAVWFVGSFGVIFFAHSLQQVVAGWPVSYWFAAQGSVLFFIGIVAVYARSANRVDGHGTAPDPYYAPYQRRIHRRFIAYVVMFLLREKNYVNPKD